MPPPFQDLEASADFVRLLTRFPFERKITCIHIHHTWLVHQNEWRDHQSLENLWHSQTRQNRWSDIAQHVTVAPDGHVWTGRDWNRPPCSFPNQNGTRAQGPFMVTIVGDFNDVNESWSDAQFDQLVDVIVRVQVHFGLNGTSVWYHTALERLASEGRCGSSAQRRALAEAIFARTAASRSESEAAPQSGRGPLGSEGRQPFGEDAEAWYQFITNCNENRRKLRDEPPDVPRGFGERDILKPLPPWRPS